ncbi:MAG TPA: YciI family protein [Puia sp.]|nr:YciI family protein [Puia sp.]
MPQFLILADDYKDAAALNRRLTVRDEHLKRVRTDKTKGKFIIGGAKLSADNKMIGSMLIVQFDNEKEVHEWINMDPYVTGKVWEHIQVLPFRVADV